MDTASLSFLVGVGSLLVAGTVIIGFWNRFSDRITAAQATANAAKEIALSALAKAEADTKALTDFQLRAAELFVTDRELNGVEGRISLQISEIKADIKQGMAALQAQVVDALAKIIATKKGD